jgi:ABC-type phosphate transport system permease subunit
MSKGGAEGGGRRDRYNSRVKQKKRTSPCAKGSDTKKKRKKKDPLSHFLVFGISFLQLFFLLFFFFFFFQSSVPTPNPTSMFFFFFFSSSTTFMITTFFVLGIAATTFSIQLTVLPALMYQKSEITPPLLFHPDSIFADV